MRVEVWVIRRHRTAWLAAIACIASCAQIIGLDQYEDGVCNPGARRPCYAGPAGTEGVGICRPGAQTCNSDGQSWSACAGTVLPATSEDCTNNVDDDCNGVVNDTCTCIAGAMAPCYSGAPATEGKGICHGGLQICNDDGTGYGACAGEQTPLPEDCSTTLDDNCDGQVNEATAGCACVPGKAQPCYTGNPQTEGKGLCHGGTQTCNDDGLGFGECVGELLPTLEDCSNAIDEDCDGFACSQTLWAKQFGVGFDQTALDVAINKSTGEIHVVGRSSGAIQFGDDNLVGGKSFLAKLDAAGKPIWAKQFDANSVVAVAVDDAGDIAIVANGDLGGGTNVMVLDSGGGLTWAKACGHLTNTSQGVHDVAFDKQGNVVVASDFGSSGSTVTCSGSTFTAASSSGDILVAKLSGTDGALVWGKQFGGAGGETATRLALDSNDNVYVAGTYSQQFSFGNGVTAYVTGTGSQAYVARLTAGGTPSTVFHFNTAHYVNVRDLAVDADANVILTGTYQSQLVSSTIGSITATSITGVDGYVVKVPISGTGGWLKDVASAAAAPGSALALDKIGNVFLATTLQGTGSFGGAPLTSTNGTADIVVAKLDSTSGSLLWNRQFGSGSDQVVHTIATGPLDEVVTAGYFRGTLAFDTVTLTSDTNHAYVFVASLAP